MGNTIYASFADPAMAERAAGALLDHGVRKDDLSIVVSGHDDQPRTADPSLNEPFGARDQDDYRFSGEQSHLYDMNAPPAGSPGMTDAFEQGRADAAASTYPHETVIGSPTYTAAEATTPDVDYTPSDAEPGPEHRAKEGISTTTPADAGEGAVKGAGWGLGIGTVAALAALFVPGVGFVVGGGALAAALGSVAAATGAGAAAGAVAGYLKDQGVDEHAAAEYERSVSSGGAILAVTLPSGDVTRERALELIEKYGGTNVGAYGRGDEGYLS
jgi:uncharacterized membrane protein